MPDGRKKVLSATGLVWLGVGPVLVLAGSVLARQSETVRERLLLGFEMPTDWEGSEAAQRVAKAGIRLPETVTVSSEQTSFLRGVTFDFRDRSHRPPAQLLKEVWFLNEPPGFRADWFHVRRNEYKC